MTDLPAFFIADAPGLDFLNSIASPVDEPVEWLDSGEGLLNWLDQARFVPAGVIANFRKSALPGELDAIAAQARSLREWFREFVYRNRGARLDKAALDELDPINRILMRDEQYFQIGMGEEESKGTEENGFVLMRHRRWRSPEALLLPLAEAMADVVTQEDFRHVKSCEGHKCTLLFVDRTRGRARRWCSMAVCGNRAKQAAHRERSTGVRRAEADRT